MRFTQAIDLFVDDMKLDGRFTSPTTERSYRGTLMKHGEDVDNRDPRTTNRDDVKRTLKRWTNPNTQRICRAHMVSFYDWAMEEGHRKDNPARQTRRPKSKKPSVYRLTLDEVEAFLSAAKTPRERRLAYLGIFAGLRRNELRNLRGLHFTRPGYVWVSADIAKGGRERHVPVLPGLQPIVEEILHNVDEAECILPAQRWRDPGINRELVDLSRQPASSRVIWTQTMEIGKRAGIREPVRPHMMRHAFADHIARETSVRVAQFLLGHADLGTTQAYLGTPTLDDLSAAVEGVTFGNGGGVPSETPPANPLKAPTRIELVHASSRTLERNLADLFARMRVSPCFTETR